MRKVEIRCAYCDEIFSITHNGSRSDIKVTEDALIAATHYGWVIRPGGVLICPKHRTDEERNYSVELVSKDGMPTATKREYPKGDYDDID